ncbi:GNAT family N-acetyltransferase [Halomonas sp. PR-M31]|uniref:GNAT family N-acetyltransferase n=1 Tax=Halomonas sp. PR-M31 TaxID=1471202 RepID=UPI00065215E2|nr:N-acetyltransferase [Halomonas sp. PR-M31]
MSARDEIAVLPQLRPARPEDLDGLCRLEIESFEGDRFNRRQLTHLLTRAHAVTWVVENDSGILLGYGTLLLRRNSASARLYSFCVHPEARGEGIGRRLAERLEQEALERNRHKMILEVRADNRRAIGLYRRLGFLPRRWLENYYSDGCAAWQMDKVLEPNDSVEASF